ncbi:MAG: Asp-tRNA(Asn)/Glu-tRNA(Gln) amidotransferase subunit GatB [Clostridia bacterium]|nr:Asp-tRNA(Asn)/Glu-tRNA(Gln) amidotransferase subunit GatB [Clostridia bacterium]
MELKTQSKIFCACSTAFGAAPNTQCCPVCMGLPGALPVLNEEVLRLAVMAGTALDCRIAPVSGHDRKNYFYPDLPKAYQISQFDRPLCEGGHLDIDTPDGGKTIGITRIHIEEDAGKLLHEGSRTLIDFNRCGVPLIEIVSEPDIRTAGEAVSYLKKLRAVIASAGISDCRMNEGSFRCDVNLSVHRPGTPFGTRTEMKNLNSFQSVQRAIEAEYARQVSLLEQGEEIHQETLRFDQKTGSVSVMRRKENADDYRYFPEPDMPPVQVTAAQLARWTQDMPMLPDARKQLYISRFGLPQEAAAQLCYPRVRADCFEAAAALTHAPVVLARLMIAEVFRLTEDEESPIPIVPAHLARVADMAAEGLVNNNNAKRIIAALWAEDTDPDAYAQANNLLQLRDRDTLAAYARQAAAENPGMVQGYLKGKVNLKKAIMGAAMGLSGGRADPVLLQQLVDEVLAAAAE